MSLIGRSCSNTQRSLTTSNECIEAAAALEYLFIDSGRTEGTCIYQVSTNSVSLFETMGVNQGNLIPTSTISSTDAQLVCKGTHLENRYQAREKCTDREVFYKGRA